MSRAKDLATMIFRCSGPIDAASSRNRRRDIGVFTPDSTTCAYPGASCSASMPRALGKPSFTHGPCITASSDSRLDVFVPGSGGANWNLPLWEDLGGGPTIVSAPDCVASDSKPLDVVVVGADGHVWRRAFAGAPSTWEDLDVYTN